MHWPYGHRAINIVILSHSSHMLSAYILVHAQNITAVQNNAHCRQLVKSIILNLARKITPYTRSASTRLKLVVSTVYI